MLWWSWLMMNMKTLNLVWKVWSRNGSYRIMSQNRTSYVILCFILLVVVVGVVVGLLVIVLAELNSRGCYMYRGGAAEISVDKYELSWIRRIYNLQLVNVTICRFLTKRELSLERYKKLKRYVKLSRFFSWHVLDVLGLDLRPGDYFFHRNPQLKLSHFPSIELNTLRILFGELGIFSPKWFRKLWNALESF